MSETTKKSDNDNVPVTPKKATASYREPTYSVMEHAKNAALYNTTPDVVRAAFLIAGKSSATFDEAKEIINSFKKKEVE